MAYSCADFVDSIFDILGLVVPDEDRENPAAQADIAIAEILRLQALEASSKLEEENGGTWGEHPDFPLADWRMDVENGDTRSGYWDWVLAQIESVEDMSDDLTGSVDHMPDRNSDIEEID